MIPAGSGDSRPAGGATEPKISLETDVLVIGSGPAGASAALFLASYGVDHLVITKYRWTANTPRAHITNQRTVEIFRDMASRTTSAPGRHRSG